MSSRIPAGWPAEVLAPGQDGWIESATKWLLDLLPGDFRSYEVFRRYPVLLARLAFSVIEGNLAATRKAWSAARISEQEFMPPQAIAEAIEQLERVGVNFGKQGREVKLVLTELERSIRLPGN